MLLEPMLAPEKLLNVCQSIIFQQCCSHSDANGKRLLLWKHNLSVDMIRSSDQCITVKVHDAVGHQTVVCSFVYAKCEIVERRLLWAEFSSFSAILSDPVGGDFHAVLAQSERLGGRQLMGNLGLATSHFSLFEGTFRRDLPISIEGGAS